MRILFLGTPQFAATCLEQLLQSQHKVVGVVTTPDRPAGRGRTLRASEVKQVALTHNLPLAQPEKLKSPEFHALLDEWDDRYRYVIELGRTLEPLSEAEHSAENKVQGCVSQVWLSKRVERDGNGEPRLIYLGDSDAHIVRGLVAIVLTLFSGHTPKEILATDALALFDEFGFRDHLTPQRSNGLRSMVDRIHNDAREALASAA